MKKCEDIDKAVKSAIASGYRLIDSAIGYNNEESIGKTLKELIDDTSLGLKREDFFITSKLSFSCSLKRWKFDYLDLFLIHWPGTQKLNPSDLKHAENRKGSWEALEKLYSEGKVRSIGISNYTHRHITELLSYCTIVPQVLQFELHPLLYQKDILDLCKKHNIQVEAYSSVGQGKLINGEIDIPILKEIADKHEVTPAQVLLRWGYQHDAIVIPKSVTPERISLNANIFHFELTEQDMESLDSLSETQKRRFCWDPTNIY
ncbi:NADP-dependent oxidoreductase domain-containing protein [Glomus cerebriforme]|uniref:NADP-dependent oxidoreductase domain-containing protein n=1 Tax=Glomus cerebriforme TaxID=658196 RepID=A0A397T879_9GLOM|nr:NADP-dependent oxidoreductase domain-containing protein [Glomus cerebriforme]